MQKKIVDENRSLLGGDDAVKKVFNTLESTGQLNNTVVVVMSDNGDANGSHRIAGKRCIYEECIKVPLLIRYPGQAGRHVSALTSNIDLGPTFAHIAGTRPSSPVDGVSLLPLINNTKTEVRSDVLVRNKFAPNDKDDDPRVPSFWGLRESRYVYSELVTGEKELYDLQTDPYEMNNLANQPAYAQIQAELAARLQTVKSTPPHTVQ